MVHCFVRCARMAYRALVCSCCRQVSPKNDAVNDARLFVPTYTAHPSADAHSSFTVPRIMINDVGSSNGTPDVLDTTRTEMFTTARTSREDEAATYQSMNNLVRKIRITAGMEDTPRTVSLSDVELGLAATTSTHRFEGSPQLKPANLSSPAQISSPASTPQASDKPQASGLVSYTYHIVFLLVTTLRLFARLFWRQKT